MPKPNNQTRREARRDVRLSYRPLRNQYRRARRTARRDERQYQSTLSDLGTQLQSGLSSAAGFYDANTAGLAGELNANLGGLVPMFAQGIGAVPEGERSAGIGLTGTIGAGTQQQLISDRQRNAAYSSSAMREGTEQQNVLQRNAATDLRNFLQELSQQRIDAMSGMPQEIRARQDELTRQAFDRRMALAQLALSRQGMGLQARGLNADIAAQGASAAMYNDVMKFILDAVKNDPSLIGALGGLLGG